VRAGKKRRRTGAAIALCALALASSLLSGSAVAASEAKHTGGFEVEKRSLRLELSLDPSNGYEGFIATTGHRRVMLALTKGDALFIATTSGRVNRRGIEAEFGDLGEVSVRFEGKRAPWRWSNPFLPRDLPQRKCRGRAPVIEAGMFRGEVRFEGENGFTKIGAQAVPGTVERHYRRVCAGSAKRPSLSAILERIFGKLQLTLLRAVAHRDGAMISFEASASELGSAFGLDTGELSYSFAASTVEREDGMRIIRGFNGEGEKGSFDATGKKAKRATATVAPPKPFAGTASYLKQKGEPTSWSGPLTVRLPGTGLLELTGPEFETALCHISLRAVIRGRCRPDADRIAPAPVAGRGFALRQRLPVPGLLRGQALLVEVAAELGQL
jgi:hypothetical protein